MTNKGSWDLDLWQRVYTFKVDLNMIKIAENGVYGKVHERLEEINLYFGIEMYLKSQNFRPQQKFKYYHIFAWLDWPL